MAAPDGSGESVRHPSAGDGGMGARLFERVLLPVANEADAIATCAAVRPYIDPRRSCLVAVHVVGTNPGYPDKLSPDAARERAAAITHQLRDCFVAAGYRIETTVENGPDVSREILETATAADVTAIGFTSRGGRWWVRRLTGNVGNTLLARSHHPVVAFPTINHEATDSAVRQPDASIEEVVLPVASLPDAELTCRTALPYLPSGSRAHVVHVIRRGHRHRGARDRAMAAARDARGRHLLDQVRRRLEAAGVRAETRLVYDRDIVDAIEKAADEAGADAIVFTPRGTARWRKLVTGRVADRLIRQSNRPVVAIPAGTGSHA